MGKKQFEESVDRVMGIVIRAMPEMSPDRN
jgi:hypothetical protein